MRRLILPLVVVTALALAGCQAAEPEPSTTPALPAPSGSAAPSESPVTAEGDPDAPEGYPIAPPTELPECAALDAAVAPIVPAGFAFDQEVSDAQDQEDVSVERQCAWTSGERVLRITVSGIAFAPEELIALSSSRLITPDAAANERGLFVMGVDEPPALDAPFAGTVNVYDQFVTASVGWSEGQAPFSGQQAVDAAVAVQDVVRG
ncbi:hypothetical protein OVA14_00285 [Agrococcus sp. SL85]|uniref:hypothetical protein n=1 Tax=Agrococcus sp. SL85 TaxID=2995141 RepID=UPI00226CD7B6|nr:hypothetical protein [Agrococcus sp. SL85]WAC66281.1 hypothetical protein OVA14_00285 [Agrococcus sp. SL85]